MTRAVAIIGPGRVGGTLALSLQAIGDRVVSVTGRDGAPSLRTFTELMPQVEVRPLPKATEGADLVLLTTPDDVLAEVARELALADAVAEGQRFVHTSGSHGIEVLSPVTAAGGRVAACHPAMTFPDARKGAERIRGASWALSAEEADLGWARVLISDLGGSPVTLAAGSRTLYHAGLSIGSNATTAVVTLARDLLLGAGISDPANFLGPLVTASAQGGALRGVEALTGPVRRGDAGTVQAHLEELRATFPEAVDAYLALGRLILGQAVRGGLDPEAAQGISRVLDAGGDPVD